MLAWGIGIVSRRDWGHAVRPFGFILADYNLYFS